MEHTKGKAIEEFPAYEVTASGEIFSVVYNWRGYGKRALTQTPNFFNYLRVAMTKNGKHSTRFVHKLVAKAFLPPKKPGQQIRHLDGNRHNNNVSNLLWGTAKDNANDRKRHGRTSHGLKHSVAIKKGHERTGCYVK